MNGFLYIISFFVHKWLSYTHVTLFKLLNLKTKTPLVNWREIFKFCPAVKDTINTHFTLGLSRRFLAKPYNLSR